VLHSANLTRVEAVPSPGQRGRLASRRLVAGLRFASLRPDTLRNARVQVRNVHELLRAAVEHGRLDELEVELRAVVEQGCIAGLFR
jgi:hypothetical protein